MVIMQTKLCFYNINLNDIVGNKYGKLTVDHYIETIYVKSNREHYYSCICDCGKKDVRTTRHNLLRGDTTSCGCAHKDAGKSRLEDLTGKRFGRWIVLYQAPTRQEEYLKKVQAHDLIKKQFARDNNIRLIEIDYKDVLYEDIVKALKYNGVY